jgi:TPR repeat protein
MKKAIHAGFALILALAAPVAPRAQTFSPPYAPPRQGAGATPAQGQIPAQGPAADLAFGAYQRGYYMTAFREAMKRVAANPRDAAAMTLIGEIYRDGYAVRQDVAEAAHWYRLASGLGDREAAFALGALLLNGAAGVDKDRAGAKAQFEKAAALGQAGALYDLGVMAIEGDGADKPDFAKAADYFRRAAEAGEDNGAYSYGVLLREGRGVPLDIEESAHWLKRAADAGIIAGQVEYAIMLFNGIGVEKNEAAAAKIFLIAAARNNPIAQNRLAHLYVSGRGVPRDLVEAATWNRFAKAGGIDDPELDAATANLTPEQNERVNQLVRRQASF